MKKRVISIALIALMLLLFLPAVPVSAATITLDITKENVVIDGSGNITSGKDTNGNTPAKTTVSAADTIEIVGDPSTPTTNKISVSTSSSIILDNVNIAIYISDFESAFEINNGASVNLILADGSTNILHGGHSRAGLEVNAGQSVTIGGTGSLDVTSGSNGAGIGGSMNNSSGEININGGAITAAGGVNGAGIGGGAQGSGGTITISGGTVNATGAVGGAGIGGGWNGSSGTVTINGGTIDATGDSGNRGIGDGQDGSGGAIVINGGSINATLTSIPKNSDGATAYLAPLLINTSSNEPIVSFALSGLGYSYGKPATAHNDGNLYLYLPASVDLYTISYTIMTYSYQAVALVQSDGKYAALNHISAAFNKASPSDAYALCTWRGTTLSSVTNGSYSLTDPDFTEYMVDLYYANNYADGITFHKEYLNTLPGGNSVLRFHFTGMSPTLDFTVNVPVPEGAYVAPKDSILSQTTAVFETENPQDIAVNLTGNGNMLLFIRNGNLPLVQGVDFRFTDGNIVISKDYLKKLPVGDTTLTFDMSAGKDPTLVITVSDVESIPIPQTGDGILPIWILCFCALGVNAAAIMLIIKLQKR